MDILSFFLPDPKPRTEGGTDMSIRGIAGRGAKVGGLAAEAAMGPTQFIRNLLRSANQGNKSDLIKALGLIKTMGSGKTTSAIKMAYGKRKYKGRKNKRRSRAPKRKRRSRKNTNSTLISAIHKAMSGRM